MAGNKIEGGQEVYRKRPPNVGASLRKFRAGERVQPKVTGRSTAKKVTTPKKKAGGISLPDPGKFLNEVNANIQGALKSSPGLRSKGIENVMKLPPKRR